MLKPRTSTASTFFSLEIEMAHGSVDGEWWTLVVEYVKKYRGMRVLTPPHLRGC
jgi:hypothetical protein